VSSRRGLPIDRKMRHDRHFVDELTNHSHLGVGHMVRLDRIETNREQPRSSLGDIQELAESIRRRGVLEPLIVRKVGSGHRYQLIAGERRFHAALEAGLVEVPCIEMEVTDQEALELALIENLQREHLNPVEIAISYRRLLEECNYTQEQLAGRIGKDRSTIANFLRLLKLPEPIQSALRRGQLDTGHARALISIEDPVLQLEIFKKTIDADLSVREVERWVKQRHRPKRMATSPAAVTAARSSLTSVEDALRQTFGTKVEVRPLNDGKGHISFEYYSPDDLERLLDLFLSAGQGPQ